MPSKVLPKRKPLQELDVQGNNPEDWAVWRDDLRLHCEEVFDDKEEMAEKQNERIMTFKTGQTFHGGVAGITVAFTGCFS